MIFVYVAIVVVKLIILFVCLSTELNPDKTAAHPIFMICWLLTVRLYIHSNYITMY